MHAVPSGLVLLAEWPEDALDAYLGGELVALTRRTVTDPDELRARLGEVRAAGCAWGLEEFAEGIDSVAAPVRDARGNGGRCDPRPRPCVPLPGLARGLPVSEVVVAAANAIGRLTP